MIKCEYGTFECKGRNFDVKAEFEVIFMNYFEVLLKHETLEDALSLYTNILKRFNLAIEKYIDTEIPFEHCDELNEQIFTDLLDNFLESETIGVGRYREMKYSYGENFSGMDYINLSGSRIRVNFINHGNKYDDIVSSYRNRIKDYEEKMNNKNSEQSKSK